MHEHANTALNILYSVRKQVYLTTEWEAYLREIGIHVRAIGRIEEEAMVLLRCTDGCQRQVNTIDSANEKQRDTSDKRAMIVSTDTTVNPSEERNSSDNRVIIVPAHRF